MKWAKGLFLLLILLVAPALMMAQSGRVTGTVTDSASGQPVPNATVTVVGTKYAAATSSDGKYSISGIPAGSVILRVQRLGFAPKSRTVQVAGASLVADFVLTVQAAQLSAVVSVGYGTQNLRDVTGSVAAVTTDALEHTPITSVDQILQGTSPGVDVTTASAEPGGALSVRIRGTSSITGNPEPLYVIDGFPIENDITGSSAGNGGRDRTTPSNPLVAINPSDIESISILKDASATAIYGARGANGVVIITTKQGRGNKPVFSLDYSSGQSEVAKKYQLLNAAQYIDYANTFGQTSSTAYTPFPDSTKARLLASGINTDWQDLIFRTGAVHNLQMTMRGAAASGASPTRYSISGGYYNTDGIVVGSGLRRLSGRVNLDQSIGSRVEIAGSINGSQARSKSTPTAGQQNSNAGAVSAAIQYVPILPVKRADGSYSLINPDLNVYNTLLDAPQTPNPVSLTNEVIDSLSDTRILANVYGQVELLDNLNLKISVGTDYANRGRNTYYPRTTLRGASSSGDAIRAASTATSWLDENTLTYLRKFGTAHEINLLAGYTRQRTDFDANSVENSNFVSDITGYNNIGAGTQAGGPNATSRRSAQTLESYIARANYSLLDRYLFTATIRRDGSSRFAENKKYGSFPSGALAWRASSEKWLANKTWIDELKFRGSYGVVGNPSIRPYQSLARLNNVGYSFNGTALAGYYPVSVANPDLTFESTAQTDYGVDFAFLKRFSLTADYYYKKTTDLLLQISLPYESGFESALANRGAVENRGFELGLDADIIKQNSNRKAFAWKVNINYARNNNKVLCLDKYTDGQCQGNTNSIFADLLTTDYNLPGTMIQVGKPIGVFYGFKSLGVIRDSAAAKLVTYKNFNNSTYKPGDELAADLDGDGVITLADRTDIGSPIPKFTMGMTNTFSFRGVELSGLLQGVYGNKILNINRIRTESSPRVNVSVERYLNAWTPTNLDGTFPRIGENPNQVGTNNFTDNLLEDGSYIRLRSLSLSFGVPENLALRTKLTGARVYITGTNLFTATHYTGFDPDVSSQSVGTTNRGIDIGAYPLSKGVTVGINLNY